MPRESLDVRSSGEVTIIGFAESDLESEVEIQEIGDELYRLVAGGVTRIALDFSDVHHVASSLLGKLIGLYRRVHAVHGRVVLFGLSPYMRTIFEVGRLDRLLPICADEAEAVALASQNSPP